MSPVNDAFVPMRILVVDDEAVVCLSCTRILGDMGHAVESTESPLAGIEKVRATAYDVVFVDLKMPAMDGLTFLRMVKELRPLTHVIVMTGFAEKSSADRAMSLGAREYILKPFTPDQIETLVAGLSPPHGNRETGTLGAGAASERGNGARSETPHPLPIPSRR